MLFFLFLVSVRSLLLYPVLDLLSFFLPVLDLKELYSASLQLLLVDYVWLEVRRVAELALELYLRSHFDVYFVDWFPAARIRTHPSVRLFSFAVEIDFFPQFSLYLLDNRLDILDELGVQHVLFAFDSDQVPVTKLVYDGVHVVELVLEVSKMHSLFLSNEVEHNHSDSCYRVFASRLLF